MARKPFTYESNVEKISQQISDTPGKVLNIIGRNLVREARGRMGSHFRVRKAILNKTMGYWARKREKDLQIGFKMSIPGIIDGIITGRDRDVLKDTVIANKDDILQAIAQALDEIGRK